MTIRPLLSLLLITGSLLACDKDKPAPAPSTTASVLTTANASSSASATVVGSASTTVAATASEAVDAMPIAPSALVSASTTVAASASAPPGAKEFACGAKGQPKCPLQGWMAANMQPALASGDATKLAAVLRQSAKFAPPGYSNWAKLANDGAAAVEASKDVKDGKPSCKSCHTEYQKKYKETLRDRPI